MTSPYARIASPFSDERWEQQNGRHFYFLNYSGYKDLIARDKHAFIIGHRGTGKTTMLKAIEWEERSNNAHLQEALGGDPYADGVVGCFLNLRALAVPTFDTWLIEEDRAVYHLMMGSYLRLHWLELASRATMNVTKRYEGYDLENESSGFSGCAELMDAWLRGITVDFGVAFDFRHLTLSTLNRVVSSIRDHVYNAATFGIVSPKEVAVALNLHRLQELTNRLFRAMVEVLRATVGSVDWTFRICLDEAEYLSHSARLSVRTLVRECESPLILLVAALDDLGVDTIHDSVNLALSDRDVINLDERTDAEFQQLFIGIVSERLYQWLGEKVEFKPQDIYGSFTLDELFLHQASENPTFRRIKNKWQRTLDEDAKRLRHTTVGPIFDNILSNGWAVPENGESFTRAELSQNVRKYALVSYFDLLRRCNIRRPTYAGWTRVTGCADNSIRDGLRFLDFSYKSAVGDAVEPNRRPAQLRRFLAIEDLAMAKQDGALLAVGRQKIEKDLPMRIRQDQDNAERVIMFFGSLSNAMNTYAGIGGEATLFSVRLAVRKRSLATMVNDPHSIEERFIRSVYICSREGFLRFISWNESSGELTFRVHRSLARVYGFSYRRPSYTTVVPWRSVEKVWLSQSHASMSRMARSIAASRFADGRVAGALMAKRNDSGSLATNGSELDLDWGVF